MYDTLCFRTFIAAATIWCIPEIVAAELKAPKTLHDFFAPVVVGMPPVNAFNGLFRRGPKSRPLYRAGTNKIVSGRKGMMWEEEDWVDEDATAHRGEDD